jgi:PTS system nitrogen regulatory IIA component
LSEIAELLSDAGMRQRLTTTTDAVELHGLLTSWRSTQVH